MPFDNTDSFDDSLKLEKLLSLVTDDITEPFSENELTDEKIIKILALNIGLGSIDLGEFGDKAQKGAEITADTSVMYALAERYFGVSISEPQSVENAEYSDGITTADTGTDDKPPAETESVGRLKLGLSADEVVAFMGDPGTGGWEYCYADGMAHQSWLYNGIKLDMIRDSNSNILVYSPGL